MPENLDPAALDRLLEMSGGDREFVCELIGEYLSDAPGQIAAMRDATGDELVRAAHTLKSTSATFGAGRLAAICSELERAARHGEPNADLVAAAQGEYDELRPALESERARFA